MKIKSISLRNFRNIETLDLQFHDHLNIFVGDNGQGKTNLIESLVFLSSGRSFRVNKDIIMIQDEKEYSKINAEIIDDTKADNISIVLSDKGKYLTHNQRNITKLSEFIGLCNVVLFNPDDIQFYTQAPRKRRKDIDYELGKSAQSYIQNLVSVNNLIQDRNAFLKQTKEDKIYLDVLDKQIVDLSVYIIEKRKKFTEYISKKSEHYYQIFTSTKDKIQFDYEAPIDLDEPDYGLALSFRMKDSLRRDTEFKLTHVGIHRDDYVFKVNNTPIINVMSQGQRRTLMIAYKLAVIDWFIETNDSIPIFCMDDLFSELDSEKREKVLKNLNPKLQIFITTTDLNFINTDKDKYIFTVQNGTVTKEDLFNE